MKRIVQIIADIFYKYFNLLFFLIIAGMYANALIYPNMGIDASFYLRVTECIADGAIPEHNLRIMYPPLVFYMLLPIKLLAGKTVAYELFLGLMFAVQLINALLILKISRHYSENKFIRFFAPLLYLFLSYKLEGEYFLLEPFINFWGLLALFLYLKSGGSGSVSLALAGGSACLAFLSKQYGLAYTALLFILIIIDNRDSFKKVIMKGLIFSLGFILALLIFIFLFRIVYGVHYDFFVGGRLNIYGGKNIPVMLLALSKYFYIGIYLIALFIPMVFMKLLKTRKHFPAYLILVFLFSFQLYFNNYNHYYILMLPAIIIIGVMMFDTYFQKNKILIWSIIILSLFLNEFFVGAHTKSLLLSKQSSLKTEMELAKEINKIIPEDSKVYVFSNVKLYYFCHFNPAIPEKFGFAWNHTTTETDLDEIIQQTDYILLSSDLLGNSYPLLGGAVDINGIITKFKLKLFAEVDKYKIYIP